MKKTLAYTATAILLGFAIMTLPLALLGPPTYRSQPQLYTDTPNAAEMKGEDSLLLRYGLAAHPSNLLPSSLIFVSGLVLALGVYAVLKRRMT